MTETLNQPALSRRNALALGNAAILAPATPAPPIGRAAEGVTIRVAYPAPVATLNPVKFWVGGLDYNYTLAVFSRPTQQDAKLQVLPDLATSWQPSADLSGLPVRSSQQAARLLSGQLS